MLLSVSIDAGPIHDAVDAGDAKAVRSLLKLQVDPNAKDDRDETPLHKAAVFGHEHIAKVLLDNGAYLNIRDRSHMTPAALARERGHQKVLQALWNSLRVKEENLAESECVLAGHVRAKMWEKQRKKQLMANGAGAHIE